MSRLVHAGSAAHLTSMDKQSADSMTREGTITTAPESPAKPPPPSALPKEFGGVEGPEPTRYGDWQHKGRVTDF